MGGIDTTQNDNTKIKDNHFDPEEMDCVFIWCIKSRSLYLRNVSEMKYYVHYYVFISV